MHEIDKALMRFRMKRKAQSSYKYNIGDEVLVDDRDEVGVVEVIEVFDGWAEYTVRFYEDGDFIEEESNVDENQITGFVQQTMGATPPPDYPIGTMVQIVGDHENSGAFGKVGYMYNRISTEDDIENWGAGYLTGWRYVVDIEGGLGRGIDRSESVEADNLKPLTDQEHAVLLGGTAPELSSEDDLIIG